MTFTDKEIKREKISVDYGYEWQFNDEEKTVDVKFYGFENRLRRFFNLEDDYGNDWIDCYATIDPVKEIVTEIYMQFISNCDVPDRELQIKITNIPEGRLLLNALLDSDKDYGGFTRFIEDAKNEYENEDATTEHVIKIGATYSDPEGEWEIIAVTGDKVDVKCVEAGNLNEGKVFTVPVNEVLYYVSKLCR